MSKTTKIKTRVSKLPYILIGACVVSTLCSFSLMAAAVYVH